MIELKHLGKTYRAPGKEIVALDDINLTIRDGEIFGIIGLSGAGKSTLVRCLNLLEVPTAGEVLVDGKSLTRLSRKELLKVPKLGPKAFEQCAGFLRVPESTNVLDNTGVHPESYAAAKGLMDLLGRDLAQASTGGLADLEQTLRAYGPEKAARTLEIGLPTLTDVVCELMKPGRDVRESLPQPILRTDVLELKDLRPGMVLSGTVRNVIDFGAFVDIGVHQDGLVHISEIADRFIKHPSQVLTVGQVVRVKVLGVDEKKKRISLSIKQATE